MPASAVADCADVVQWLCGVPDAGQVCHVPTWQLVCRALAVKHRAPGADGAEASQAVSLADVILHHNTAFAAPV